MIDEDKERAKAARGLRFREWCEGPDGLFAVLDEVRARYLAEIANSAPSETEFREGAYHRIRALQDISERMQVAISAGMGSSKILAELTRKNERKEARSHA